jgi:hypothetical protein
MEKDEEARHRSDIKDKELICQLLQNVVQEVRASPCRHKVDS